jgi:hypothetical protein
MSTPDRDTVDTVAKLLTERRKVRDWLAALDQRRASTPPAVFEKVYADYTVKLDKVQAKLVAASDAVQVAAADVAARLTDKEEEVARKRDERAEAELRYAVGEYSEKEWEKRRTKLDDDLGVVTGERDAMRDELHRLRDVLADVAGERGSALAAEPEAQAEIAEPVVEAVEESAPEAAAPPVEVASEPEPEAPVEEPPVAPKIPIHEQVVEEQAAPAASAAPEVPEAPSAPSFDELAFLKSVVGRNTPAGTRHPAEPALVPKRSTGEPRRATPTPVRTPAVPPATGKVTPAAASETPAEPNPYAVPEPPMPFPDPVPEPRVSQEMTPPRESFFGRPTPRTSEAVKSLRCQECGTLNFPTEWYCERCGGELAAF